MKKALIVLLLLASIPSLAQTGGRTSFEFLNVPNNARLTALGGVNVSLADRDVNFFQSNPALVSDTLAGTASASYHFFIADIGQATFSYAHDFNRMGVLSMGIQHIGYGAIESYDAAGNSLGTVHASETALVIGKSHQIGVFRFGVNVKGVFSNLAGYRSSAVMMDIGGTFVHPKEDFTVGLVVKNLGVSLSQYTEGRTTDLPFDVRLGATFKPEHMPFRFSLTAYQLGTSHRIYDDPAAGEEKPGVATRILRHVNFGAEVLLHRNVNILVGYNFLTHQELKLANGGGGAGVSVGFSARIRAMELVFARGGYVAGKAGYCFTLAANLNKILTRR